MTGPPPPPPRGLSLYDNLHDPNDPSPSATISSAPVLYGQNEASSNSQAAKKAINPALQFQPIRRPQVKQTKPKATFPKTIPKPASAAAVPPSTNPNPPTAANAQSIPQKSTLAHWTATEEDEWMYGVGEKRQRGGRKKKKKQYGQQIETDWNELYDPTKPTNVEDYLRSDEKVDEVREWKALLYRHRKQHDQSDFSDDSDEDRQPIPTNTFAPPSSYSFAPPPRSPPAAPPPGELIDDAGARRTAISADQTHQNSEPSPPPPPPPPPPPTAPETATAYPPPPTNSATISKAPVRYVQPTETPRKGDMDDEAYSPPPSFANTIDVEMTTADDDSNQPRTNRPGQAGFAHRLMSKYGWTKGTALGANQSGILDPLRVQVEKRRKKADADGGGWAEPGGKGKVVGGKRREEAGSFGSMSEVIVLQNMLENMTDLPGEIADGLGQEIGEECGEKYGRVERLYIDQDHRQVFIKFTNQVSALRAVNELDGRVFNGNKIIPKFFDAEKFERGIYKA